MDRPETSGNSLKSLEEIHVAPKNNEGNYLMDTSDDDSSVEGSTYQITESKPKAFSFYEFGIHEIPFQDILHNLAIVKEQYRANKTQKAKRASASLLENGEIDDFDETLPKNITMKSFTKTFSIRDYQETQRLKTTNAKISQFKTQVAPWDSSYYPSAALTKQLYRTPCRDPSGKVITSLARDEAKGVVPWKPCEVDRQLPDPKFTECAHSFQIRLLSHLDEVVERVEKEFLRAPSSTQYHSNVKARIGADLNNLKQKRDQLKRDLDEHNKK